MDKNAKENKQTEDIVKRYSLSKEEKEKVQKIQDVMKILLVQIQGLNDSMNYEFASIRGRLGIKDDEVPEGCKRMMDFDPKTFELLIIDMPIPKSDPATQPAEVKNPVVN